MNPELLVICILLPLVAATVATLICIRKETRRNNAEMSVIAKRMSEQESSLSGTGIDRTHRLRSRISDSVNNT